MEYPHRLKVTRKSGTAGSHNTTTHVFTPGGADDELYDGPADVQDVGEAIARNASGMPATDSEATAFVENEVAIRALQPDDIVLVGWDGPDVAWNEQTTSDARIGFVRLIDAAVLLRFL